MERRLDGSWWEQQMDGSEWRRGVGVQLVTRGATRCKEVKRASHLLYLIRWRGVRLSSFQIRQQAGRRDAGFAVDPSPRHGHHKNRPRLLHRRKRGASYSDGLHVMASHSSSPPHSSASCACYEGGDCEGDEGAQFSVAVSCAVEGPMGGEEKLHEDSTAPHLRGGGVDGARGLKKGALLAAGL